MYITGQIIDSSLLPKGILLMYQMGAGKTMPSIAIAMKLAYQSAVKKRILVISKKSVRDNYIGEVNNYMRRYIQNHDKNDDDDKKYISWMNSMKHEVNGIQYVSLNSSYLVKKLTELTNGKMNNWVVVIDEAHNFFNMFINGSSSASYLYNLLLESRSSRFVFLSGTPMVNDPFEIVPCINLLKGKEVIVNDYDTFIRNYLTSSNLSSPNITLQNTWDLQNRCIGVVSYSSGD